MYRRQAFAPLSHVFEPFSYPFLAKFSVLVTGNWIFLTLSKVGIEINQLFNDDI